MTGAVLFVVGGFYDDDDDDDDDHDYDLDYDLGGYKKGPPRIFTDGREAWYMVNYKEKIIFRGCRNGGGVPGIPTLSG